MAIVLYFIRGLALLWYLISPTYRRKTNARWKETRRPAVVSEICTGVIGIVTVAGLVILIAQRD